MAEDLSGRNGTGSGSARRGAHSTHDVRLTTAEPAHDRKHSEPVARQQAGKDLARLLETDADLHCQTRGAESSIVTREHGTKTSGHRVRPIRGPQARRTQAIEATLV